MKAFATSLLLAGLLASPVLSATVDFTNPTGTAGSFDGLAYSHLTGDEFVWTQIFDYTKLRSCSDNGLYAMNGEGLYGVDDCSGSYTVARQDGADFAALSLGVATALDFRNFTASTPPPERYTDAFLTWAYGGIGPTEPQFAIIGYRDGQEVARQGFDDIFEPEQVSLAGFGRIDRFTVQALFYGNTFVDDIAMVPDTPNSDYCYAACYQFRVTDLSTTAPVPLPDTAGLLGVSLLGLAFWRRRWGA